MLHVKKGEGEEEEDEWMNERMSEWTNEWMYEWMNEWSQPLSTITTLNGPRVRGINPVEEVKV